VLSLLFNVRHKVVHVGFVVHKVALGQVAPPSILVLPCQFHSTGAPLLGKTKNIILITGLHNKPQSCGASVASAAGPFTIKKKDTKFHTHTNVRHNSGL
jgi:hypothetical protein